MSAPKSVNLVITGKKRGGSYYRTVLDIYAAHVFLAGHKAAVKHD